MQANPVCWFDLHVADLDRAAAFYERVLAQPLTPLPAQWGRQAAFAGDPAAPNAGGALVERPELAGQSGSTVVYFACDDCAVEAARAAEAGGAIAQPKTAIGEFGFVALIRDPDGNTVGLHSRA